MIGSTISHYKILEKLGEGGMGVVYKAQDEKLNRTVALKLLPDRVNQDSMAKERFLQEAQAAAGLNHPNICTIFGVDEHEGHLFISMEYVEGGTLREKLPFAKADEAITLASQIGEALQEAHAKGIVHRDVKADNIMLTSKGQAKVTDFGLAKLKGALKLTRTSSTVGTLGYMAPEQIQGGEVDPRSDIFSFGVLLFEILTGKLPFRGEHEAAMVYSIVNEEPLDITTIVPNISPVVANLIQRCLEKDPAERYQHFDDIVADLKRAQRKTSRVMKSSAIKVAHSETAVSSESTMTQTVSSPFIKKPATLIGIGALGIVAVLLVLYFVSGPSLPKINPNMKISTLQIPATEYQYPGISPDGKWLTFTGADLKGAWDVYMMFIETGESKRVTNDSTRSLGNAGTARFSLDGSSIVYGRLSRGTTVPEVCLVSVLSGQVRVLADTGIAPKMGPDRIYYYRAGSVGMSVKPNWREYWSVSPQGGDNRLEFVDSLSVVNAGGLDFFTLAPSPVGTKLMFTRVFQEGFNEIFLRDLLTGDEVQFTHDKKLIDEVEWLDNGYVFYTSNRGGHFNIWAVPQNGGDASQVTRGEGPDNGLTMSTSSNRIVFSQRNQVSTAWIANMDGSGNRQLFPDENILESHIAPDGNSIVLRISHPTLQATLMLREISGGRQEILLPSDSAVGRDNPIWSPNGKAICYLEYRTDSQLLKGKIIDLAGGRKIRDLGAGIPVKWVTDSTIFIIRNSSNDPNQRRYNWQRILNLNTGVETVFFRDSADAIPLLNNTMIAYGEKGILYLLSEEEFRRNPTARGKVIMNVRDISASTWSDSWFYYRTAARDALWRLNLRTLRRQKILDLQPRDNVIFEKLDYNDKILTYSIWRLKTNIIKVDNVFAE